VALAVVAMSSKLGRDLQTTLTAMFNPLPAIALLPVAMLWFGLGTGSLVFVLAHSVIWSFSLSFISGFDGVSQTLRMVGRNYGLSGISYIWKILIPAAFPSLLTGLRLGWVIAPSSLVNAMARIQGQTTSGPNSLVQRALIDFDFSQIEKFLIPVKNHIRQNAATLREKFREATLGHCWYQSTSAFYFMIDFSRTPMFRRFEADIDHAYTITDELLESEGITVVPGSDFGIPNTARISLVIEEVPFQEAITKIVKYLNKV
jgi:hypothetical protein